MKHFVILSIIIFILHLCNRQPNLMKQKVDMDSVEINDPIVPLPYEVKNIDEYVILPDSLGGSNVQGYIYVKLLISDDLKIHEISIMKLSLKYNDKRVDYSIPQGELPTDLHKYAVFVQEYCRKRIVIEKKKNAYATSSILIRLNIGE